MLYPTHIALGLIIGKLSGDYSTAMIATFIPDLDHLRAYFKRGVLFTPKEIVKASISQNDEFGEQRSWLHSLLGWIIISAFILLINFKLGLIFSIAYLGHLVLDALDRCGFHPFYPSRYIKLKGPVPYASWYEFSLIILLFSIFLIT